MKESTIIKIIKGILVSIIMGFFLFLFVGYQYLEYKDKKTLQKLEENLYIRYVYKDIGKYRIGEQNTGWSQIGGDIPDVDVICDMQERKCYSIGGVIIQGDEIYVYHDLGYNMSAEKQFGIFTQDSINFYSFDELEGLPQEQQETLLDLKERPMFQLGK